MAVQAADSWGEWQGQQAFDGTEEWADNWEWNEPPVGEIGATAVTACGIIASVGAPPLAPLFLAGSVAVAGAGEIVDAGHRQMAQGKMEEVETGQPSSRVKVGLVVSLLGCGLGWLVAVAVLAFGMAAGR